ncbi:MAG TPA: UDP-N-acetylglucosamine 2-epimerase [Gemmatimonadaceae bacterium]|nr:UDP-N-acetylglucosamine 2-epimerase [Gemmatimonadaceae bacterium]
MSASKNPMCADKRRRIAVLTTGRQDFGIIRSVAKALDADDRFQLLLWAGGMHLDKRFGYTVEKIAESGLRVSRQLAFLQPADANAPEFADIADFAAVAPHVAMAIHSDVPDALLLTGDRPETLAAAAAATLRRVPIVHLHGGEESEGAIDNVCRHAITKMSHLHLVSHPLHAQRVLQMGEDPQTVIVVGAPGLDNLYRDDLPSVEDVARKLERDLPDPLVLVTLHPTTLGDDAAKDAATLSEAMAAVPATYVITAPNSDAGGEQIRRHWQSWVDGRGNAVLVDALGEDAYWSLMKKAKVVLGNSSSGIIEAPAAGAPVINVGDRQKGRLRHGTIVDVPFDSAAIKRELQRLVATDSRVRDDGGYPTGAAAPRILEALANWKIPKPPRKTFNDLECRPRS